jgi:ABC-type transport system involved in cytochrome c biogenesis permease subunit
MTPKPTVLGLLIYLSMAGYLVAFALFLSRKGRAARGAFLTGFVFALGASLYRWHQTAHVPLQNLFEVFLCLGMLAYPLSELGRKYLEIKGQTADALIGLVILFPAGFVFSAEPQKLPPALQSWMFGPHVAAYMLAYVVMFKAAVLAGQQIVTGGGADGGGGDYEKAVYNTIRAGFPLLTLGLILGAWWGKIAWGDYWNWDPKELWSLATWLVYVAYFHVRGVAGRKYPRLNSAMALTGAVFIVLTLVWVNLARFFVGLHNYAG